MNDGANHTTTKTATREGETVRVVVEVAEAGTTMRETNPLHRGEGAVDDYDERPVESARELEELVRLRAELSWSAWKSHPRFKKDRLIREAQRRYGVVQNAALWAAIGPAVPANDVEPAAVNDDAEAIDADRELALDPAFSAVCDASRDAWIEALEHGRFDSDNEIDGGGKPRQAGGSER